MASWPRGWRDADGGRSRPGGPRGRRAQIRSASPSLSYLVPLLQIHGWCVQHSIWRGAGEGIDDREKSLTSLLVSTAATPFAPFTSLGAPSWFVLLLSLPPTSSGESLDL